MSKLVLLQILYRGSYACAAWLFIVFWNLFRRRQRVWGLLFLTLFWLFLRARRREPNAIRIQHHTIPVGYEQKVILLSDMHLGVYKNATHMRKVVDLVNQIEDIDMVLLAGDFTYEPLQHQDLGDLFHPLQDLTAPAYAVLGNHDVQRPGPPLRDELVTALLENRVTLLNNDIVTLREAGREVVGLGSHMNDEDHVDLLIREHHRPRIVLTHNPDTTLRYTSGMDAAVTLVGHTHCGQIRIPWLYTYIIPTDGDFDCGLSQLPGNRWLYISPGLGEVGLPMRFRNPPTIDILTFEE